MLTKSLKYFELILGKIHYSLIRETLTKSYFTAGTLNLLFIYKLLLILWVSIQIQNWCSQNMYL